MVKLSRPGLKSYRTAKDILLPKGNVVVYVHRMKKDVERTALAVVRAGEDMHWEFQMHWDDALRAGLIEEVSE